MVAVSSGAKGLPAFFASGLLGGQGHFPQDEAPAPTSAPLLGKGRTSYH